MSAPANLTAVTVTATYIDAQGNPASGYVTFTPTTTLLDGGTGNVVLPKPVQVGLTNGAISAALFATDDTDAQPQGWAWKVDETNVTPGNQRVYYVQIPSSVAPTVSLAALGTAVPTSTTFVSPTAAGIGAAPITASSDIGGRFVALGDSITLGSDIEYGFNGGTFNYYHGSGWVTPLCALSKNRIRRVRNVGIAGNTTTQMLARFNTDVVSLAPNLVIVLGGTNDVGQSVSAGGVIPDATTYATFQSNIRALVAAIRAIGATPVLGTIPPNNLSNRHTLIIKLNNWLRRYAASQSVNLVDFYAALVDPTTGGYSAAAQTSDGTHPGDGGYLLMAQAANTTLLPLTPNAAPPLAYDNTDPLNLIGQGLMLGTPNGAGIPAPWATYSGPITGVTISTTTDANIPGKLMRFTCVGSASNSQNFQTISTGFTPGDTLQFSGVVTCTGGIQPQIRVNFNGGSPGSCTPIILPATTAYTRLYAYQETVVPAGTTTIDVLLAVGPGTGTADFGQITIYNLTQQGIVNP